MAITFPLTPPAAFKSASVSIVARNVVSSAESPFTLQQQVYQHQGQRWEVTVKFPTMARADAESVLGFILSLCGQRGTFYLGDTANKTSRGTIAGSPTCSGAQTAGSTTLTLTGHTGSLAVGDWIQIGSSLYKVVQVNSAGSVDVWPSLRSAHAGGTAIVFTNPVGIFRLDNSATNWTVGAAKLYELELSAVEVLP